MNILEIRINLWGGVKERNFVWLLVIVAIFMELGGGKS